MLRVYKDRSDGLWLEIKENIVVYVGDSINRLSITQGSYGEKYLLLSGEWNLDEADKTYELWELS